MAMPIGTHSNFFRLNSELISCAINASITTPQVHPAQTGLEDAARYLLGRQNRLTYESR